MVLTVAKNRLLQAHFDRSETVSFVVEPICGAYKCSYEAYSWREVHEHCLEWGRNVTVEIAYKTRIKVFLEVPRIRPSQDDDTFDDVLRIASDGSLVKYSLKISPHFDADTTALYLKTNEELSKVINSIKTKEQCEQLKLRGSCLGWILVS